MSVLKRVSILVPLAGYLLCALPACSSDDPSTSRVLLTSTVGAGNQTGVNDQTKCQLAPGNPWVTIGDPFNSTSVFDGDQNSGNTVSISCKVYPETDGFHVEATAKNGTQGAVTIVGHFLANTPSVSLDSPITGISASFARADTGNFNQSDCTVTYSSNNAYEGVAAGRVWADIDCPKATYASQGRTCDGSAMFKFENCAQTP